MADIPSNLREDPPGDSLSAKDEDALFRHKERVQQAELGSIGKILGSEKEKPGNISGLICIALVVLLALLICGWLFICMWSKVCTGQEPFQEIFSGLIAVITLILGYLFGSHK